MQEVGGGSLRATRGGRGLCWHGEVRTSAGGANEPFVGNAGTARAVALAESEGGSWFGGEFGQVADLGQTHGLARDGLTEAITGDCRWLGCGGGGGRCFRCGIIVGSHWRLNPGRIVMARRMILL